MKLSKWQVAKLKDVIEKFERCGIHADAYNHKFTEEEFNIWANTWIIPQIEEVIEGKK